jgi:ketosteroid isomerase-like protein
MADVRERAGDMFTRAKRRIGIENPSAAEEGGKVGIVRGALRAFGEGNHDQFLDALKPDVEWEAPGNDFPGGEKLSGRDEIREKFIDTAGRTFTEFGFIPESYVDADDENAVIVFGQFKGEGAEGAGLEVEAVQVWVFAGNEAEYVRIYTDSAEFPEVVTEEKQQQWQEEKERKEEEEREEAEGKGDDDEDSDSEDDDSSESDDDGDDSESKSEDDSESKSDDDSESKSDDDSESKSEDDSESKSDDDSDGEESGKEQEKSETAS